MTMISGRHSFVFIAQVLFFRFAVFADTTRAFSAPSPIMWATSTSSNSVLRSSSKGHCKQRAPFELYKKSTRFSSTRRHDHRTVKMVASPIGHCSLASTTTMSVLQMARGGGGEGQGVSRQTMEQLGVFCVVMAILQRRALLSFVITQMAYVRTLSRVRQLFLMGGLVVAVTSLISKVRQVSWKSTSSSNNKDNDAKSVFEKDDIDKALPIIDTESSDDDD